MECGYVDAALTTKIADDIGGKKLNCKIGVVMKTLGVSGCGHW